MSLWIASSSSVAVVEVGVVAVVVGPILVYLVRALLISPPPPHNASL